MTTTPAKATSEPAIERGRSFSLRNTAASSSAISGAMKVSAMAWASGTRPMPQKNRTPMTVDDDAAARRGCAASRAPATAAGAADRTRR